MCKKKKKKKKKKNDGHYRQKHSIHTAYVMFCLSICVGKRKKEEEEKKKEKKKKKKKKETNLPLGGDSNSSARETNWSLRL